MGGATFRERLLERVEPKFDARGGQRTKRTASQPHEQSRAEQTLAAGLRALGLLSGDLAKLPKGQTEKLVLAWWQYGQTTFHRRWLAGQLRMGYETRISQAVSLVESSREPMAKKLERKLNQCGI